MRVKDQRPFSLRQVFMLSAECRLTGRDSGLTALPSSGSNRLAATLFEPQKQAFHSPSIILSFFIKSNHQIFATKGETP